MDELCEVCGGACCEAILLLGGDEAGEGWVREHGAKVNGAWYALRPCSKLTKGLCSDYDNRPPQCRAVEVGGEFCKWVRGMRRGV